jgi:hypothetical protein
MPSVRAAGEMLRRPDAKPSGVVVVLDRYPAAAIAGYAGLHADSVSGQLALRYLAEWRHVRAQLRGDELQTLGVPAGPQVERGLQLLRAARLDGGADGRDDERAGAVRAEHPRLSQWRTRRRAGRQRPGVSAMTDETYTCVVCGEPVDAAMSAECNWCDGRYHLNQRNDVEAQDCGQVWIDEQFLALQFACDRCLAREGRADPTTAARRPERRRRYRRRA